MNVGRNIGGYTMLTYLGRKGRVLVVPPGRLADVAIPHPERTTTRSAGAWDVELREWPSEVRR
jgi:hypothetical protein